MKATKTVEKASVNAMTKDIVDVHDLLEASTAKLNTPSANSKKKINNATTEALATKSTVVTVRKASLASSVESGMTDPLVSTNKKNVQAKANAQVMVVIVNLATQAITARR